MFYRASVTTLVTAIVTATAIAQGPKKDEVIANEGNWRVQRDKDSMTDKVLCVAFFKKDSRFQLGPNSFYISYKGLGGVETYRIRFDDEAPTEGRLATPIEQKISAVRFTEAEVKRLVRAKRLRVSTFTFLSQSLNEDIDLSGIAAAHAVLQSGKCK